MAQFRNDRRPDQRYAGKKGFDEDIRQYPKENMPEAEAVGAQDLARFVMREMGSFFPPSAFFSRLLPLCALISHFMQIRGDEKKSRSS